MLMVAMVTMLMYIHVLLQVFKLVTGHVTLASLKLILEVLEPKTSKDELMEEEEQEEEGGEMSDGGEDGEDGDGGGDSEDSDVSEDIEEGHGEEMVDPVFRAEVQRALGAAAVGSDAEVCTCTFYDVYVYAWLPHIHFCLYLTTCFRARAPLTMMP